MTGATAWTWDGKRFWGIAAGKALAWSQDGKTLQIGEQPAASTAFAGPIKLASTNDFPLVGALKDDVAATPAGVEEWGDNRGLSNAVTGRPATAISDGVREALINIGEPVSEIGRFAANYGRVNFGRPSGWDNSSQALLVGYGDEVYASNSRYLYKTDPIWGVHHALTARSWGGVQVRDAAIFGNDLYGLDSNGRLLKITDFFTATNVGAWVTSGRIATSVGSGAIVLCGHAGNLYAFNSNQWTLYQIAANGATSAITPSAVRGFGDPNAAATPDFKTAVSHHGHMWVYEHNDSRWHRMTEDDGTVVKDAQKTIDMDSSAKTIMANVQTLISWNGRVIGSSHQGTASQLIRIFG